MKKSKKTVGCAIAAVTLGVSALLLTMRVDAESQDVNQAATKTYTEVSSKVIVGKGALENVTHKLKPFEKLTVKGQYKVDMIEGHTDAVNITAPKSIMPDLTANVKDDTLELSSKPYVEDAARDSVIAIVTRSKPVNAINLMGDITLNANNLKSDKLRLAVAGESVAHIKGEVKHLNLYIGGRSTVYIDEIKGQDIIINIAGKGTVYLKGQVQNLKVSVAGKAIVNAKDLKVVNADIRGAGNAVATINASKKLDVTLFGEGVVNYVGNPTISKSALGKIEFKKVKK